MVRINMRGIANPVLRRFEKIVGTILGCACAGCEAPLHMDVLTNPASCSNFRFVSLARFKALGCQPRDHGFESRTNRQIHFQEKDLSGYISKRLLCKFKLCRQRLNIFQLLYQGEHHANSTK